MTGHNFSHRSPKSWLKIMLTVASDDVDPLVSFLADLTGGGLEQIPDAQGRELEMVIGYLPVDSDLEDKKRSLHEFWHHIKQNAPAGEQYILSTEVIQEEDWSRTWKARFKPLKITRHLVIKPTWEEYQPAEDELIIELDPGMAFGTGHHASTKLALELIDSLFFTQKEKYEQVLDVGTGTGILAMAGALFGARHVAGIDNDPDAVAVAQDNIALNRLAEKVTISGSDLRTLPSPFDLIIANITHDTLVEMAPLLTDKLKKNGALILAGILRGDQEDSIRTTYENLGIVTQETRTEDEWVAFHFCKP